MKPNFIIIGAARSGTTSLHKYLEGHPEIYMSEIKEINYFSNDEIYKKGEEWYFSHFSRVTKKMVGEASTSYTLAPLRDGVPRRIHDLLGPIKMIYILRDPVERFLSHYVHYVQRGEISQSLSQLFEKKDHSIFVQGRYAYQMSKYFEIFPRENLHVLTVDQLKSSPEETVCAVYRFLGVDDAPPEIDVRKSHNANECVTAKNSLGKRLLRFYHKQVEPRHLPYPVKKAFLKVSEIGSKEIQKPTLSKEQLQYLVDYYKEDVNELRERFNIDVRGWRNFR